MIELQGSVGVTNYQHHNETIVTNVVDKETFWDKGVKKSGL